MVQPISSRDAELNFLPLGNLEVFEQPQIAVKIGWVVQVGPVEGSLGSESCPCEEVGVEIQAGTVLSRVAGYRRQEQAPTLSSISVCAQPGLFAHSRRHQSIRQRDAVVGKIRSTQAGNGQAAGKAGIQA